jgi:hypothetical protein
MKRWERFIALAVICTLFTGITASAQHTCATAPAIINYDTTVAGSGNAFHTFTFPKFDPALGTLIEVDVSTQIKLSYSFQLENKEGSSINYRVRVVRDDEISGMALPTPLLYSYQKTYGPYTLTQFDGVLGSGTDYMGMGPVTVLNNQIKSFTNYNTADFLGTGTVDIDYSSTTYAIVFGSLMNNFNGSSQDSTLLRVTYKYCNTFFLPADITSFTARKTSPDKVDLQWIAQNEKLNRTYEIQKSTDGRIFVGLTKMAASADAHATGSYRHQYTWQPADGNKLIFRLKQTEGDGSAKYSVIRIVERNKETSPAPRLYPNPSSGSTQLLFNHQKRGDWDVSILTTSGQLIKVYHFNNALVGRLNTNNELAKGLYMIRSVNRKTQEQFVDRLVIR